MVLRTQHFVASTLSAFYFHLVKDRLYCDPAESVERRSAVTALSHILAQMKVAMHPILPVMTSEIHSCQLQLGEKVGDFVLASESDRAALFSSWKDTGLVRTVDTVLEAKTKALTCLSDGVKPPDLKAHDVVVVSDLSLPSGPELREIFGSASAVHSDEVWSRDDPEVMTVESACRTVVVMAKPTELMLCPRCRLMSRRDLTDEICCRCRSAVN